MISYVMRLHHIFQMTAGAPLTKIRADARMRPGNWLIRRHSAGTDGSNG